MVYKLIRASIIAAIYVVLCIIFQPMSYGVIQLRLAEGLTLLPILYLEAVPGLFIGALIANVYGGLGLVDIIGGSLTTLIAAYATYRFRGSILAYFSPVVFNGLIISAYLHVLFNWPYWATVISISLSEGIVVFSLGHVLVTVLKRYGIKIEARA